MKTADIICPTARARDIGDRVEAFVREVIIPLEANTPRDDHGAPTDEFLIHM